jgi:hypothetical protein
MVPADHDFAPREGELAGMDESEVLEGWGAGAAAHHFMSGGCTPWIDFFGAGGGGEGGGGVMVVVVVGVREGAVVAFKVMRQ